MACPRRTFGGSNLIDPLGGGASRTVFNGFDTSNLSVGQHTLWIGADNFGQTTESDETNNWQSITFTVTAPPQADLVVSNLGLGAASVAQGQNLGFVYTILNNGAAQSNVGYGGFYIDGTDPRRTFGGPTSPIRWASGASRTLFNGFNTGNLSVGQHTLWIGRRQFRPDDRERREQQLAVDHLHGDGAAAGGPRGEQPRSGRCLRGAGPEFSASSIPS